MQLRCIFVGHGLFTVYSIFNGKLGTTFVTQILQVKHKKLSYGSGVQQEEKDLSMNVGLCLGTFWSSTPSSKVAQLVFIVIVSDTKTSTEYRTGWVEGEGNEKVIVLTRENQESVISPFVKAMPWNHFGRKNIG